MAQYDTLTKQVNDEITVTISKKKGGSAGDRLVAFLEWLADKVQEGGQPSHPIAPGGERPTHPIAPGGGGERPDQGLPPSGNRPDQGLPPGGERPDQGLPPSGVHPSHPIAGLIGENAEKLAKLILASCFDCKVPDQGLPGGGAQPKK